MAMRFLRSTLLRAAILCALPTTAAAAAGPSKPDLLILVADDLGWGDVGYLGGRAPTLEIDRLADEGLRLTRFYVRPACSPTRAGLLTGRYPDRFGMGGKLIKPQTRTGLDLAERTLPEILAKAGYARRGLVGKWHLGHASRRYHPLRRGFSSFYGSYNGAIDYFTHMRQRRLDWHRDFEVSRDAGYATELIAAEAVRFIEQPRDEPFLLWVAFTAPHTPLQAPLRQLERFGYDPSLPPFESDETRRRTGQGNTAEQTHRAMLASLDEAVGEILKALDANGLRQNTLVLFLSDNGANPHAAGENGPLRGGKETGWEGGVRVPAILRWPARGLVGGRDVEILSAYVDVLPTFAAAAGAEIPDDRPLDGRDLLRALAGDPAGDDRVLYLGGNTLVTRRWKLIDGRLFRIDQDPGETRNVASLNPGVLKKLNAELQRLKSLAGPPRDAPIGREPTGDTWQIPDD